MIITAPFEPITLLPPGTVLMYHGTGINNVAGRTLPLGLDPLDTIVDVPYGAWYVCNGNSGTPHLLNYFIRSEASSGNTGGSDNAVIVEHQHAAMGNHYHELKYAGTSVVGYGWVDSGNARSSGMQYSQPDGAHQHAAAGVSGVNANMPLYFSLIFIIRMT